jgi:hypothetical protein
VLVDIDHLPFKVRCPNLRPECYLPDGEFNKDFKFPGGKQPLEEVYDFFMLPKRIGVGTYEGNINFHVLIQGIEVEHVWTMGWLDPLGDDIADKPRDHHWWHRAVCCYGVADNLNQVRKHLLTFISHPTRQFCLSVTWIHKDDGSGWRWHKWGGYIGKKKPKHEYLKDEGPDIQKVLVYNLHEVKLP